MLHKLLEIVTHPYGAKVDFIFFNICVLIIDFFLPKGLDGELTFKKGCRGDQQTSIYYRSGCKVQVKCQETKNQSIAMCKGVKKTPF